MKLRTLFCCCAAALALTLCAFAADITDSGTCGENLTWTLDGDGVLTISGKGAMDDYGYDDEGFRQYSPWHEKRNDIVTATIQKGVLTIGDYAFLECENLTSVIISDSVISIGYVAFGSCWNLTSVTMPHNLTTIGGFAFQDCMRLTDVTIPDSVTSIGQWAFCNCDSLTNIIIPDGVTSIGEWAFYSCNSLASVIIPESVTRIEDMAFYWCDNLTDVYYAGSAAQWNEIYIRDTLFGNKQLKNATIHYGVKDVGVGIALTDESGKTVDANGQTGEKEEEKENAFQEGQELKASFTAVDPNAATPGEFVTANVFVIFYDKDGLMVSLTQKEIDLSDPLNLLFALEMRIPEGAKTLKILMLGDNFEPLRAARFIESSDAA